MYRYLGSSIKTIHSLNLVKSFKSFDRPLIKYVPIVMFFVFYIIWFLVLIQHSSWHFVVHCADKCSCKLACSVLTATERWMDVLFVTRSSIVLYIFYILSCIRPTVVLTDLMTEKWIDVYFAPTKRSKYNVIQLTFDSLWPTRIVFFFPRQTADISLFFLTDSAFTELMLNNYENTIIVL